MRCITRHSAGGGPRRKADRPDAHARARAQRERVRLMRGVLRELNERRTAHTHLPRCFSIHRHGNLTAPVNRGIHPSRRVLELQPLAASNPRLARRSAGQHLGRRRDDHRSRGIAGPQRLERLRQPGGAERVRKLLLYRQLRRLVLTLAEVEPAQRSALAPEEERRPALAAVVVPERVARVVGDRVLDSEIGDRTLEGLDRRREGVAWRVDAERREPELAVSPVPVNAIGQRAHAVQLSEVEEVDQHGPASGQLAHRRRLAAQPAGPRRQLGRRDVLAFGAHRAATVSCDSDRS